MDRFSTYAELYDLEFGDRDDDLLMIEQFATRCGSPILELGCGTGRVLLPLARKGFQVTGVDNSPAMLERARRTVAAHDVAALVSLVRQDMRELDLNERFSLVFAAANTFMDLQSTVDQLAVLDRVRQHLIPGGLILLDLFHPDLGRLVEGSGQVIHEWTRTDPHTGDLVLKFYSQKPDLERQVIHFTYFLDRVAGDGSVRRTVFPFSLRYLFRAELELLLRHAGFEVEALYGSHDLDEFASDSEKLIAVARKPG